MCKIGLSRSHLRRFANITHRWGKKRKKRVKKKIRGEGTREGT